MKKTKNKDHYIDKNCKFCKKKFRALIYNVKKGYGIFCSRSCVCKSKIGKNGLHWKGGKIQRKCIICHKKFSVHPNVIQHGKGKFCSRSCGGKRTYGRRTSEKINFKCVICRKSFWRYASQCRLEPNRGKCCNYKCRIEFTRKQFKKICLNCGKKFSVFPSNENQNPRLFCNIRCLKIHKRTFVRCEICKKKTSSYKNRLRKFCSKKCQHVGFSGNNNPMYQINPRKHPAWKGGSSFLPYPPEWTRKLKEQIRVRDERKCQLCKTSEENNGKRLDVHHIDYIKNNLNPRNLISLCSPCHFKTSNNRSYWIELFKNIMRDK